MRLAAEIGATFALLLALVIRGIDRDDLLVEELLDRAFDLDLVRLRADAEDVLVVLLGKDRCLLRQRRGLDDVEEILHSLVVLPANCSSALPVTKILSNASSCSVFTSWAVGGGPGFTLRAAR